MGIFEYKAQTPDYEIVFHPFQSRRSYIRRLIEKNCANNHRKPQPCTRRRGEVCRTRKDPTWDYAEEYTISPTSTDNIRMLNFSRHHYRTSNCSLRDTYRIPQHNAPSILVEIPTCHHHGTDTYLTSQNHHYSNTTNARSSRPRIHTVAPLCDSFDTTNSLQHDVVGICSCQSDANVATQATPRSFWSFLQPRQRQQLPRCPNPPPSPHPRPRTWPRSCEESTYADTSAGLDPESRHNTRQRAKIGSRNINSQTESALAIQPAQYPKFNPSPGSLKPQGAQSSVDSESQHFDSNFYSGSTLQVYDNRVHDALQDTRHDTMRAGQNPHDRHYKRNRLGESSEQDPSEVLSDCVDSSATNWARHVYCETDSSDSDEGEIIEVESW